MAKKALCIGINDYPGTGGNLSGCLNDAHDWAETLTQRGFSAKLLLDAQATRAAMSEHMAAQIAEARKGDTVVITFSGHGTWVPDGSGDETDGRDEGLCPCDVASHGPLLDDEIQQLIAQWGTGVRIVMLFDCCHSGAVTRGGEDDIDPFMPRTRFLPPEAWMPKHQIPLRASRPPYLVSGLSRSGCDLFLSACKDTEYSWDSRFRDRTNGAFSFYALKTLRENKPASYDDWFHAIRAYLPSTKLPQTPQILGSRTARRWRVFE